MQSKSYEDILNLPHHVSETRPRMSMEDRAAQFSPFAALTGYDAAIAETARRTDRFVPLGEDRKAVLNGKLQLLAELQDTRPEIALTYFEPDERKPGGVYRRITGRVKRVDGHRQALVFTDGTEIPFLRIYEIDGSMFRHLDGDCRGV